MRIREIIEGVQQHHPHVGETEITKLANRWLNDYTYQTRILYGKDTSLSTTANTDSYAIPSTMFIIEKVSIDGSMRNRIVGDYAIGDVGTNRGWIFWQTQGDTLRCVQDNSTLSYLAAGLPIVLWGYKYNATLGLPDDEPDMPEAFHEAILFAVLSTLYLNPPNLDVNLSAVYRQEYNRLIRRGKRYARSHRHKIGTAIPRYM